MKKIAAFFYAAAVAFSWCLMCFAETESESRIFQVTSGRSDIYFYINATNGAENIDIEKVTVVLTDNNKQQTSVSSDKISIDVAADGISKISDSDAPQSYMFLIDAYNDGESYRNGFSSFIDDFMENAAKDTEFSLVTIVADNKIEELASFTSDRDAIKKAVNDMKIIPGGTSLYSGLMKAIELYNENDRAPMEVANIIVISDGIESADSSSVERQELENAISAFQKGRDPTSVFTIHTIQYKADEKAADFKDFAEISHGTFYSMSEKDIAPRLLSYINDSYLIKLSRAALSNGGWTQDMLVLNAQVDIYNDKDSDAPVCTTPEFEFALAPLNSSQTAGNQGGTAAGGTGVIEAGKTDKKGFPIVQVIIGAVILLTAAAGVVLFLKMGKKNTKKDSDGVYLKIEFVSGVNSGSIMEVIVKDEVLIGRDAQKCSLPVKDSGISSVNSKIFQQNGTIYIEDLNSLNGTAINDMAIHAPNKLLSGDVVTVGASSFIVRF